jgi:hypothetical protein
VLPNVLHHFLRDQLVTCVRGPRKRSVGDLAASLRAFS